GRLADDGMYRLVINLGKAEINHRSS
ncbi:MAG: hypothetical protein ACI9WT_001189, partial [Flavobacterium sp.]